MNAAPTVQDRIPRGMCRRCGFPGPHAGPDDCIDALRDQLAQAEFKITVIRAKYSGGRR